MNISEEAIAQALEDFNRISPEAWAEHEQAMSEVMAKYRNISMVVLAEPKKVRAKRAKKVE